MRKFKQLPLTLYRIQPSLPVKLRSYDAQMALGRSSFDLKLHDGLVKPIFPADKFHTPNGMSLRPDGTKLKEILETFRGSPTIFTLRGGMELPEDLCVYHEHTDHYSLQTEVPISLDDYNKKLTDLLMTLPSQSKEQLLEQLNDENDQDS